MPQADEADDAVQSGFDPLIDRQRLQQDASRMKSLVVQMVYSIRNLLGTYKFFNESFVFNDRDYLKYVASEMQEIKSLMVARSISFN